MIKMGAKYRFKFSSTLLPHVISGAAGLLQYGELEGAFMASSRGRAATFATDDWMFEQQVRAELEAEAWRRLREERALAAPPEPAPAPVAPAPVGPHPIHRTGSAILKALVRFAMAAAFAYLALIAAIDSQLGEFEAWLAIGATFVVTLALSMFSPLRGVVHMLAETARWALIVALALGGVWMFVQMSA